MQRKDHCSAPVPDLLLQEFSDFLTAQIGWCFPKKRWSDLLRGISALAQESDFPDPASCMRRLMRAPLNRAQIESLARHLSVGETYFFRDPGMFQALEQRILPSLIEARRSSGRRLRIWSAGCCSGEEAYSVAILIHRLIPDFADWDVCILGTDIHCGFLKKAVQGVYREWSFRGVPDSVRQRNFVMTAPGSYAIRPSIKQLVRFEYGNLASDVYPALENHANGMDLILCRNVLMYFDLAQARQVIGKLHQCLVEGGWLAVSPSEMSQHLFAEFSLVNFPEAALYRKEERPLSSLVQASRTSLDAPGANPAGGVSWRARDRQGLDHGAAQRAVANERSTASTSDSQGNTPYDRAFAFYQEGAYRRAVDALKDEVCGSPHELALLARAHANLGELAEAANRCEAAIALDKCNPGLRYLQAVILEERGCIEQAKTALKRALYLDQNFVMAHFSLGNLCRRQGKPDEAARHFDQAIDLLHRYPAEVILPESEGLAAARLIEIIRSQEGVT